MDRSRRLLLHLSAIVVLFTAAACRETPTGPDGVPSAGSGTRGHDFTGTWVGTSRIVSCEPAGAACAAYQPGLERYFSATLTRQGDVVDGSITTSPGGPLALPYGFPITGRVLPSGQLSFERLLFSDREPRFSGDLIVRISSLPELAGRMTEQGSSVLGHPITLVWDVVSRP
jgi:hypothetical protein